MSLIVEQRPSDSPLIDSIARGRTTDPGSTVRPAETHWHMVFTRHNGTMHPLLVGPLTSSGVVRWGPGAEILWIKFKLGAFMPHLPLRDLLEKETLLPDAGEGCFQLNGSAWEFPDFENADTFVDRLVRQGLVLHDPLIEQSLLGRPPQVSPRTLRHRFLRATGFTQGGLQQYERAQRAASLLEQGRPILDTVFEAGYFDQPHLTRSLKRWIGHTPARVLQNAAR